MKNFKKLYFKLLISLEACNRILAILSSIKRKFFDIYKDKIKIYYQKYIKIFKKHNPKKNLIKKYLGLLSYKILLNTQNKVTKNILLKI